MPAAAGMAKLPYRTFVVWNVAGGLLWASAIVLGGYAAGSAYKRLEHYLGRGALAVLAVVGPAWLSATSSSSPPGGAQRAGP